MLPFVAPIVRAWLLASPDVAQLVDDRVYSIRLPNERVWPLLLVTPIVERSATNAAVDHTVATPMQVEAFGRDAYDHSHARLIAATAHARLRSLPQAEHPEGHVSSVRPEAGLQPLPNDEHDRARWTFTVRVTAHPHLP